MFLPKPTINVSLILKVMVYSLRLLCLKNTIFNGGFCSQQIKIKICASVNTGISSNVFLYYKVIPVVENLVHVGMLLYCTFNSNECTKRVCNRILAHYYAKYVYVSTVWMRDWEIGIESLMLRRDNRFIVNVIQCFNKRSRTDIPLELVWWTSMEGYIDSIYWYKYFNV